MGTSYFVAAFFNELVQALNSGLLLVIRPKVKYLGYGAIFPIFNLDLNAGDFLRQGSDINRKLC